MRDQHVSTMVLHGEKDMVVPFDSARDMAEEDEALLAPDAPVRELATAKVPGLGVAQPEHVQMELVRRPQRTPWMRRTRRTTLERDEWRRRRPAAAYSCKPETPGRRMQESSE
jgi:hypothetical protein